MIKVKKRIQLNFHIATLTTRVSIYITTHQTKQEVSTSLPFLKYSCHATLP